MKCMSARASPKGAAPQQRHSSAFNALRGLYTDAGARTGPLQPAQHVPAPAAPHTADHDLRCQQSHAGAPQRRLQPLAPAAAAAGGRATVPWRPNVPWAAKRAEGGRATVPE